MPSPTTPSVTRPTPPSTQRRRTASPAAKPRKATQAAALPHDGPDTAAPAPALEMTAGPALLEGPTRDEMIRVRAYERYERNGCVDGNELDDWLAAEAEVGAMMGEGSESAAAPCE